MSSSFVIRGRRIPLIAFEPNWEEKVSQTFGFDTDVFMSRERIEQRGTTLGEGRFTPELRVTFLRDGLLESARLWNTLLSLKGKPACVPWYPEPMLCATDLNGLSSFSPSNWHVKYLKMRSEHVLRIDDNDWSNYEARRVLAVDETTNTITLDTPWDASVIPTRQVLYFVTAMVLDTVGRTDLTDTAQLIPTLWRGFSDGYLP